MKKLLKFITDRPELDGIALGVLLAVIPFLFKEQYLPFKDMLEWDMPDIDDWQVCFLLAIPCGAEIGSLTGGKFNFSLGGKNPLKMIVNIVFSAVGGILAAAGVLLAGGIIIEHGFSAAVFSAGSWLFLAGCLVSASLLALISCGRSFPGGEK